MKAQHTTHDKIKLRSEKIRLLIEEIPPSVGRWSLGVILVVLIALLAAICLLPYPYSNGESILQHILN